MNTLFKMEDIEKRDGICDTTSTTASTPTINNTITSTTMSPQVLSIAHLETKLKECSTGDNANHKSPNEISKPMNNYENELALLNKNFISDQILCKIFFFLIFCAYQVLY